MPFYRFNIHNGNGLTQDEEGRELPHVAAARAEALTGIRSILAEDVLKGRLDLRGRIEILDGGDAVLLAIGFAEALVIEAPEEGEA